MSILRTRVIHSASISSIEWIFHELGTEEKGSGCWEVGDKEM